MWIKLDKNLTESAVMTRVETAEKKTDPHAPLRSMICLNLFIHSANDISWRDAKELSRFIHMPIKSCERVWSICIEMGVLKEVYPFQYNAKQWLIDGGFLGKRESGSPAEKPIQKSKNIW